MGIKKINRHKVRAKYLHEYEQIVGTKRKIFGKRTTRIKKINRHKAHEKNVPSYGILDNRLYLQKNFHDIKVIQNHQLNNHMNVFGKMTLSLIQKNVILWHNVQIILKYN